ncbi:DUF3592 domain-containing protein [Streptomyces sp. WI04-05B]|uniref:DUF3592 domain-containing protein n=1 Tax=Streptomyces TaxID=1883 RepID=UPI0029B24A11|nr:MULTISPECIES: DUF3592 domain-containing protein [unclassified Streptomyces]MDX2543794.1 hypothetical protein [Streptomyces sp. WI04-05B]MDX2582116.1 hypothetical protein [Streptomyces sp. WI04-05A]MDX3752530.1 hypothetical protein [Streptomyces sp. AK08-02]
MDFMFYGVPTLMITVVVAVAVFVIRRALRTRRAWNSGLTAEARCLRTYTTTSGGSGDSSVHSTLHHVYEFVARDGRTVRFEESGGPGTILEGDFVTVFYSEGERVNATAHRPSPVRQGLALAGILAFLGVFVMFCVGFMVTYSQIFEPVGDMFFGDDSGYSSTDTPTGDGFPEGWDVSTDTP